MSRPGCVGMPVILNSSHALPNGQAQKQEGARFAYFWQRCLRSYGLAFALRAGLAVVNRNSGFGSSAFYPMHLRRSGRLDQSLAPFSGPLRWITLARHCSPRNNRLYERYQSVSASTRSHCIQRAPALPSSLDTLVPPTANVMRALARITPYQIVAQ